jgi:NifB/MoaA-like Fe-S oxidoreductase
MSIAVVPVGITAFRKGRFPLRTFSRQEARRVLETISQFGARLKKQFGTRLVFPSDEFFIKAGEAIPAAAFYEEFSQIENGVGMVADFLREASRVRLPKKVAPIKATLVTGVSFSKILSNVLERLRGIEGAVVKQVTVQNRFFGPSVTVTGLLAGKDIQHALQRKQLGDIVMVPAEALKEGHDVFLDNMSLEQLSRSLSTKVVTVSNFKEIVATLRKGSPMV